MLKKPNAPLDSSNRMLVTWGGIVICGALAGWMIGSEWIAIYSADNWFERCIAQTVLALVLPMIATLVLIIRSQADWYNTKSYLLCVLLFSSCSLPAPYKLARYPVTQTETIKAVSCGEWSQNGPHRPTVKPKAIECLHAVAQLANGDQIKFAADRLKNTLAGQRYRMQLVGDTAIFIDSSPEASQSNKP